MSNEVPETIVDALCSHVETQGDDVAYTFLKSDDERLSVTYRQLDKRAKQIARGLLQHAEPGDRALMMYPAGLDFIEAFLGCLYAGIVAVPAYPPKKNRNAERILAIAADCTPRLLLCTSEIKCNVLGEFADYVAESTVIGTNDMVSSAIVSLPQLRADQLTFLQYTSGSTAAPKGVMVTHGNIVANERLIQMRFGLSKDSVVVSWLPMFHDMGLIGGILAPLFVGCPSVLMSPNTFLREPIEWLRVVTEFHGTCTGAPNFAYDLCVKNATDEQKQRLDLSSLTIAFNGAEPVRAKTLASFSSVFADCGFNADACFPCYGLAETTLLVSGGPPLVATNVVTVDSCKLEQHQVIQRNEGRQLVSCGQVGPDLEVRIIDCESFNDCQPKQVGEIWVHGASVAKGYWNRPQETQSSFSATLKSDDREWFRTGDLGFMRDGELYVTGRLKDVIIIRGRNIYPQDIEQVVEHYLTFVEPNSCAAFSVTSEGQETLVIVAEGTRQMVRWGKAHEPRNGELFELNQTIDELRNAILNQFEIALTDLVFVRPASFPRTSSGKVQRQLAKRLLHTKECDVIWKSVAGMHDGVDAHPECSDRVFDLVCNSIREWASGDGRSLPALTPNTAITSLALDSIASVDLALRLENGLGICVERELLYRHRTLGKLARELVADTSGSRTFVRDSPTHASSPTREPCVPATHSRFPVNGPLDTMPLGPIRQWSGHCADNKITFEKVSYADTSYAAVIHLRELGGYETHTDPVDTYSSHYVTYVDGVPAAALRTTRLEDGELDCQQFYPRQLLDHFGPFVANSSRLVADPQYPTSMNLVLLLLATAWSYELRLGTRLDIINVHERAVAYYGKFGYELIEDSAFTHPVLETPSRVMFAVATPNRKTPYRNVFNCIDDPISCDMVSKFVSIEPWQSFCRIRTITPTLD